MLYKLGNEFLWPPLFCMAYWPKSNAIAGFSMTQPRYYYSLVEIMKVPVIFQMGFTSLKSCLNVKTSLLHRTKSCWAPSHKNMHNITLSEFDVKWSSILHLFSIYVFCQAGIYSPGVEGDTPIGIQECRALSINNCPWFFLIKLWIPTTFYTILKTKNLHIFVNLEQVNFRVTLVI